MSDRKMIYLDDAIDALIRVRKPINNGDGTMTIISLTDAVIRKVLTELPSAQTEQKYIDPCDMCQYNSLDWHEEPCESCTVGGEDNHWKPSAQPDVTDINVGDIIYRQAAIDLVKDVCEAILSMCGSHYDGEDEVYDDLLEVDAILKCNKEIRVALKHMPSVQPETPEERIWGVTVNKNFAKAWDRLKDLPSAQPVDKDVNVPVKDCISRQLAIDAMCELMHHWFGDDPKDEIREIKRELEKLPSAQTEHATCYLDSPCEYQNINIALPSAQPEVIRCKYCKWHNEETNQCNRQICASMYDEDFCSRAERRTDE